MLVLFWDWQNLNQGSRLVSETEKISLLIVFNWYLYSPTLKMKIVDDSKTIYFSNWPSKNFQWRLIAWKTLLSFSWVYPRARVLSEVTVVLFSVGQDLHKVDLLFVKWSSPPVSRMWPLSKKGMIPLWSQGVRDVTAELLFFSWNPLSGSSVRYLQDSLNFISLNDSVDNSLITPISWQCLQH